MLHGILTDPTTCEPLALHPTWRLALAWLKSLPGDIPIGRHNLLGESMFALVQEYETLPEDQCRFESHREHVDLQYTISGRERIDWAPRSCLQPDGAFEVEKDYGFWLPPPGPVTSLLNSRGRFAIFHPEDAHRPKVRAGEIGRAHV